MTKQTEALKMAIEALENTTPSGFNMESDKRFYAAIQAYQEALAEAAMQQLTDVSQEIEAALAQPETLSDTQQINAGCWHKTELTHQEQEPVTNDEQATVFIESKLGEAIARVVEAAHEIKGQDAPSKQN